MRLVLWLMAIGLTVGLTGWFDTPAAAQAPVPTASKQQERTGNSAVPPKAQPGNQEMPPVEKETRSSTEVVTYAEETSGYREVSDFFNIREANPSVSKGEWEFETTGEWVTGAGEGDDDFSLTPSLKYGISDDLFIELEVLPLNLGDGGDQGNGDLALVVFNRFIRETESLPAFAVWAEMRIPSGEGSSGVDGTLNFNLTKELFSKFRAHLGGFIETANGGRGDEDENRRPFQWGVGPAFDYQLDDKTMVVLNYLMRSSEERGHPNQNILEVGLIRELTPGQHLKFAVDVGLDGHEETPEFGAKVQWSLEW